MKTKMKEWYCLMVAALWSLTVFGQVVDSTGGVPFYPGIYSSGITVFVDGVDRIEEGQARDLLENRLYPERFCKAKKEFNIGLIAGCGGVLLAINGGILWCVFEKPDKPPYLSGMYGIGMACTIAGLAGIASGVVLCENAKNEVRRIVSDYRYTYGPLRSDYQLRLGMTSQGLGMSLLF